MVNRLELMGSLPGELERAAAGMGEAPYRGRQLFQWLHRERVYDLGKMTNLPLAFRKKLAEAGKLPSLNIRERRADAGGLTTKLLLELDDGELIECVLMSYIRGRRRQTACVSSQAGCAMRCSFCATGQGGFRRNLTAGEIVLQAAALAGELEKRESRGRISNIVFMGMGEPLLNYEAVIKAVRIFEDPLGWGISRRRITLSTCGLVPQIERLSREEPPLELSVSLHATTNEIRDRLIPVNRRYPLEQLVGSCRNYVQVTGRRVTIEYSLVSGLNDSREDASRLVEFFKGMQFHINLIPLNPVMNTGFKGADRNRVRTFAGWLKQAGMEVSVRDSRGRDIDAACGQLRNQGITRCTDGFTGKK